jgi:RNA polymerase sigma-70 factor (ECF subfamily)
MTDDADTARQLNTFLAQVERRAFRIAEIATRNTDDALDIVQDAMLKLVQKYARRNPDEWPALFYRILNNRINDWHRRGKVSRGWLSWWGDWKTRDDEGELAEPEFAGAETDNPLEQLAQNAAMQDVVAVLGELPQRQQQAFMLRIWEGLDGAQTAYAMGCSEGSVKTHLSRATARLRERLEKHR